MHRQSSRSTINMDAIDCIVNTNDLALESEELKRENDQRSKSRRDQPLKRSNESSTHRSNRRSPPSVTRKHQLSSPSISSSLSSRSHHRHYPSQKHHRVSSSPSPPPPPPPSSLSRHHRPTRPIVSEKRPPSQSTSPHERRPPARRSRPKLSTERTIGDVFSSAGEPKKITSKQESGDLSFVSEDESTKTHAIRSNGTTMNESSSITTNNKLHSTPSLPILQPNSNESFLETSTIPPEYELSLFAKSALSTTSSILPTSINPMNDFMQTIDLISKYKTMQAIPNTNPQVEAMSKEILIIIQKQIELQKIELDCREREIKLRKRELAEREKHFNEKSTEIISMTSVNNESLIITKPTIIEENLQSKSESTIDQNTKNILQEESVTKTILSTIDTSKVNLSNKSGSAQSSVTRKISGKSRFSPMIVDPSIFFSQEKPSIDLYSDDLDDNQNTNNSLKKPTISKILAPQDLLTDLKVTSSNSFRKVEIQSGIIDKTTTKGSSHDLRLTLSKNRTTKQSNNDDHQINENQTINDDEQTIKIKSNDDNKQQSHDYQQQRSITSTSIETIIDNTNDKRDDHRHRQQQYSSNLNERSYTHGSTSQQQQSKYGSNQKRYENDDLRSRIFEHKHPKSSRTTHKNNY